MISSALLLGVIVQFTVKKWGSYKIEQSSTIVFLYYKFKVSLKVSDLINIIKLNTNKMLT